MSSQSEDLTSLKTEIEALENELPLASSRDAALEMAMDAAEKAMKLLKLSKDPTTMISMRHKVRNLLGEAERIKFSDEWIPRVSASQASKQHLDQDAIDAKKVIKLKEPASTRDLPKSEQILLLKASHLNGFKFPPWKEPPLDSHFELAAGQEPFTDVPELRLSELQLEVFDAWKRADAALPPPAWHSPLENKTGTRPTMGSSRKIDLVQDAATDCSVVASLCAVVARGERGHARLLSSIMYPYDAATSQPRLSPNGKYVLKLNFNGTYRKVEIDDRLPVSKSSRVLHVIDRHNPELLWPALIEKAYLKVRGSYDFPGSNSGTDLWILSGWIPEQVFLQSDDTIPNQVWKRIYNSHKYGDVLVTMGTGKISHRTERATGLAGEHDYAVLDMREIDGQKLMLVKNPWCEGTSWKGSMLKSNALLSEDTKNEDDEEILLSSRDLLNAEDDLTPGTFWMDLNSVVQHFESIYLNWNPGLFSYRQDIHFSWNLADLSLRGKYRSLGNHPQFRVSTVNSGTIWVLLSRHFRNAEQDSHISEYISLYAFDSNGSKVLLSDGALQRGPFVDSPQTLLRLDNIEGGKSYTIVPVEQDLVATSHSFSLSVFSSSQISIEEAANRYRCSRLISSSWTEETAGGNANSPTYSQNPQFSIGVLSKTPIALLLETSEEQLHVHVKLVHGRGSRIQTVRSRDIVFDSKDYRRGCALAQFNELEAGTYTIICSTFEAGQKGSFTLRVDSMTPAQVTQLPRQGAGRLRVALAKAAFEGQQRTLAAPVVPKRLTKLDVVVKQINRSATQTASIRDPRRERSMIRVTLDMGTGPERRVLIASANGEFSDSLAGVRTGEIDLSPYQTGRVWLVIERMYTPRDLEEEIFQVETFTDVPDAVQFGVWRRWELD